MPCRDRKVVVEVRISTLVPVTSNDGGYLGRECKLCGQGGYARDSDYGYRHGSRSKDLMGNEIVHTRNCVLNQYIERDTGRLIEAAPKAGGKTRG